MWQFAKGVGSEDHACYVIFKFCFLLDFLHKILFLTNLANTGGRMKSVGGRMRPAGWTALHLRGRGPRFVTVCYRGGVKFAKSSACIRYGQPLISKDYNYTNTIY